MKTLFRDLWLADGSNSPLRKCAVLIHDDRVVAVESEITRSAADKTISLGGKVLAPGFIDVHGHSDLSIWAKPEAFGKVSQGITCEIMGNCGLSAFPISSRNKEHLLELYRQYGAELNWTDFAGWRDALCERKPQIRVAALVGHNTLRAAVAGYGNELLSARQLAEMRQLLERELSAGVLGLSSGLLYVPGKFATPAEITELMHVVAKHNKIYTTHLRSEGDHLLESLDETIECAQRAGLKKLHISHFKTAGKANWGKLNAALERLEDARSAGIRITVDRYAYTESMTQLSVILPGKAGDLDDSTLARLLDSPGERYRVTQELAQSRAGDYWENVTLVSTQAAKFRADGGRTIAELAARENRTPAELVVDLLRADASGTSAAFRGMSGENMRRIIALPFCMAGSDENARPADYSIGRSHPRGFGNAARFLRIRLDENASIESAVHQMTGLAAATFELHKIGLIEPGAFADLVGFDPDTIDGTTDFAHPHTPATGILFTMLSGNFAKKVVL
ncbi:MAG: amidohydrolase family protein [Victivallales bacterium]|jgi:N-acyl-D-amino-acid deacylase|nr:amidohydrolase family protein [Victivallales bacterium]